MVSEGVVMTAGTDATEPARQTEGAPSTNETPPTVLKALLRERNWHSYAMFKRAYVKTAKRLDSSLASSYPSDRTYKRWISGRVEGLPRAEHCAVLEEMFPGWLVSELLQPQRAPGGDHEVSLIRKLLQQRHLQTYRTFCASYDDAARQVNSTLKSFGKSNYLNKVYGKLSVRYCLIPGVVAE